MEDEGKKGELERWSPKVREMLGKKPHWLIRRGIGVLALVFAALAIAVGRLEYPHGDGETILRHIILELSIL